MSVEQLAMGNKPFGAFHKWDLNSWMVYFRENPNQKMEDDLGVPPFMEPLIEFHVKAIKQGDFLNLCLVTGGHWKV